tara:strand:- start:3119 stop:3850 length:732 start_codon:yes stop_codon:yes gene_type:complete
MINQDKWIASLPNSNFKHNKDLNEVDSSKWIETIPKKNKFNSVKKYSLMISLFVFGLFFVSVVKNETRNLQKEINNLKASINVITFDLKEAVLDNEVITSPENIAKLAKEYLNTDLVSYKKSQIENLNNQSNNSILKKRAKIQSETIENSGTQNLTSRVKVKVAKKILKKKSEIKKLQGLYEDPDSIPDEIKLQVSKKVSEKRKEIRNIYMSPGEVFTLERVGRWGIVQVVKLFLGMPVVPGR